MSRTALNAIVDAVAYAGIVVLATTGLMLRWQMPPGSGGLHGMGSGSGAGGQPTRNGRLGTQPPRMGQHSLLDRVSVDGRFGRAPRPSLEMDRMRPSRQTSL